MADQFSRDRLMPALLDRLIDERPGEKVEAVEARMLSKSGLRQSVLRDLGWLFNAQALAGGMIDAEAFPLAAHSTINFGITPLSGMLVSKLELSDLEQMLRQAIIDFEPRILPDSIQVRGIVPENPLGHHNSLSFEIVARLWAQPYPLELLLKTDLDLETGLVELKDRSSGTIAPPRR
ncbi:MAG: type VI secretion system baseplate subunit TssE [Lautropia sp.]